MNSVTAPDKSDRLLDLRVSQVWRETADIIGIELVDPSGAALPRFEAGAHLDVFTPAGVVRQYSLFNDPAEQHRYCLAVLLEPKGRGGSRSLHERVRDSDVLRVSCPRNKFPLVKHSGPSVLLAGGIGITPILSMAHTLLRSRREFELHYCTRSIERTAFYSQVSAPDLRDRVHLHLDDGPLQQKADLSKLLSEASVDSHLYYCGPDGFMQAVTSAGRGAGWSPDRMHCEYFGSVQAKGQGEKPFIIRLAGRGLEVPIGADETVVQALGARGIFLPTSCEQGFCGSCVTRILSGIPDHRDSVLTDAEKAANDCFTPCCSRAHSDVLVLDL